MAGEGHVQGNQLKLRVPIVFNTEHAQFVNVSETEVDIEWQTVVQCNTFHEGQGM